MTDTSGEAVERLAAMAETLRERSGVVNLGYYEADANVAAYLRKIGYHTSVAATLRALAAERDAAVAAHDQGREWMRIAWREFNAIRARSGAPDGVSHEWWDEITEALREMLADDALPWMTKAAKLMEAHFEKRIAEADDRAIAAESATYSIEAERDAAQADARRLREALEGAARVLHKAGEQFTFYANEHAKKGTADGDAKAATNQQWAQRGFNAHEAALTSGGAE